MNFHPHLHVFTTEGGQNNDGIFYNFLFWEHEENKAVRHSRWKLVSERPDYWELYDLEQDRTELNNLAEKYPGIVQELKAKYEEWAKNCGVR